MAKRRMFLENLIESDDFYSLSNGAQLLYIHLNLVADDDGLVGNAVRLIRSMNVRGKHLDELCKGGYVIRFESGVVAITHWLSHNQIRKDRYTPTRYIEEFSRLKTVGKQRYILDDGAAKAPQICDISAPQVSSDKVSEEKERIDQSISVQESVYCAPASEDNVENSAFDTVSGNEPPINLIKAKKYIDTLNSEEKDKYKKFLNEVRIYFLTVFKRVDAQRFIDYNEARFWRGKNGESVMENYKHYIREWMAREG